MRFDTIIAGGGLAGACVAFTLSQAGRCVLLLEKEAPAAGASGVAAGLVNPFMARRARPSWRFAEALDALDAPLDDAGAPHLFRPTGVLRPARSLKQAGFFAETAEAHADHAAWLPAAEAAARFPSVDVPHGALWIPGGGAVDMPAMVEALLEAAEHADAEIRIGAHVTDWGETSGGTWVEITHAGGETGRLHAGAVLLALGQGAPAFDALSTLNLRAVKGQTVRIRRPDALEGLPALSGSGYVAPYGATLLVGSSYEHDFVDLRPDPTVTRRILQKAVRMLPVLASAEVIDERAGARVYAGGGHLPVLGPLPDRERIWVFTGLGSRGLLTAPLLARSLPAFLAGREAIPEIIGVPVQ